MDNKKLKLNLILGVAVTAVVFAVILTLASFYDLSISKFMTSGSLAEGEYYASNQFALFFEVMGGSLVYIAGGAASLICLCSAIKMQENERFFFIKELKGVAYKIIKVVLIIGFSVFAVYELYEFFHDAFKYTDRILQGALIGSGVSFTLNTAYLTAVQLVLALLVGGLIFALLLRVKKEDILKLLKLAIAILIVEALYLAVVGAVKGQVGRVRYRAMNALGDFSYYTPWYVINGSRDLTVNGIVTGGADSSSFVGAASDTCRSFPSGHTYCAAMSFALVCLPDLIDRFKKTYIKVLCWVVPVVYTVTVAVCRIVVGAHYLSDVLVGGTLAFTAMMIVREVLILNCAHFKAFIKKKQPEPIESSSEPVKSSEE